MSSKQLAEWQAYSIVEPFGGLTDYWRAGLVTSAIINMAPGRKKGAKRLTPQDFIPMSQGQKQEGAVARVTGFFAKYRKT